MSKFFTTKIRLGKLQNPYRMLLCAMIVILLYTSNACVAQSTFGSIVGTVRDASGAVVNGAEISLINLGTDATRQTVTNESGSYAFVNLDAGKYQITIHALGFQSMQLSNLDLGNRETRRADATLSPGAATQSIMVQESAGNVITTDVSNLAVLKTSKELVDLPVAIYSRSSGSTSPISTLTTDPGIQTDDSGNLVIAGTTPALLSVTIDGISSVDVENSGPINELFPSFNSINEIHVSQVNNNAEFSGVADITTTSKSGSNQFHGGLFENHINSTLSAGNPFSAAKPKIIMNDFGGYAGGPVIVPHYNGHDKTFFFASYEGLRLPREQPIVASVPSMEMRSGNLTNYLAGQGVAQINSYDGTPLDPSAVPVNAVSAHIMSTLMPAPNTGDASSYVNNYATNFPAPISSNQADLRIDQSFGTKQTIFARFTYKDRSVTTAPDTACESFCATAGSPSTGAFRQPEKDRGFTVAYNYVFSPALLNELRGGFNSTHTATSMNVDTTGMLNQLGITGIPVPDSSPEVPNVQIVGFMATGGGNPSVQRSNIIEVLDNLTWTRKNHTLKFGVDFKRMTDHDDNVFGSYRSGQYLFNATSTVGSTVGDPFAAFLLGYPDSTILAQVNQPAMNGLGHSYAFFAQDDWKITPSLTLNFGLRWELHPPLKDTSYNTAAFLPDYYGVNNGQMIHGAVAVPNEQALALTAEPFAESIAPTPILTAKQAGVPATLRYTDKTDYGPRIGFAWRPLRNDKTVIRGGYGRFIESPLGFSLVSGWAVSASYVATYNQDYDGNGQPLFGFPRPFPSNLNVTGTASFEYAFPVRYHDPSVQQWNLTMEQDIGHGIGLRASYIGSRGANLETMEDLNQVPANTLGYDAVSSSRPYPIWGILQSVMNAAESNYNSFTFAAEKRFTNGLQFQSSYVWTRDLSNAAGANPTSFAGAGGNFVTDRFHPGLDYGNVSYDRRHRFLTTYLYELPFGRGAKYLNTGSLVNTLAGGWQWGGVLIFQSGPFLTPFETSTDPAGTNVLNVVGYTRADILPHSKVYAAHGSSSQGDPLFLSPAGFAIPNDNIGRFGNAAVGSVVGPGTQNISMSLLKSFSMTEKAKLQLGIEAANLFNRRNYEPPNMQVDAGGFGTITALQTAEGAGPRQLELTGRITF